EHCREGFAPLPELLPQLGLAPEAADSVMLYRGRGCATCRGTGYHGRVCIVEMMPITTALRRLILSRAETQEIEAAAIAEGMRTMFKSGLELALAGTTTVEEVMRATRTV